MNVLYNTGDYVYHIDEVRTTTDWEVTGIRYNDSGEVQFVSVIYFDNNEMTYAAASRQTVTLDADWRNFRQYEAYFIRCNIPPHVWRGTLAYRVASMRSKMDTWISFSIDELEHEFRSHEGLEDKDEYEKEHNHLEHKRDNIEEMYSANDLSEWEDQMSDSDRSI